MEASLRDFTPDDFETLWSIDQKCFTAGIAYSRRELSAYIRMAGAFTLVAEVGQTPQAKIMGFLVASPRRNGIGHIITIDVVLEARRTGLGSMLLAAAEARLRAIKCHSVSLETAVDNQSALAFYKRHRYFVVKTVPRFYSNGVDALVLQKDLLSAAQAS